MNKLKIKNFSITQDDGHLVLVLGFNDGTSHVFEVKNNATPEAFIKLLRSMIWRIEQRSQS